MTPRPAGLLGLLAVLAAVAAPASALRLSEGTNLSAHVSPADGHIAMDLLGSLWLLPPQGGEAERIGRPGLLVERPRWSPDGRSILLQADAGRGAELWHVDVESRRFSKLSPDGATEQHAIWHPSGTRILYATARDGSGLDLWERDLETGLRWRLTDHAGDESAPAWSADGRHLVYVLQQDDRWYLMLRRFAQPPRTLVESDAPLLAPAWRPDNTLVTYLGQDADGSLSLRMLILSDPPLERVLADGEDFFAAPLTWIDRSRFVYTADGVIKARRFEDRSARVLPFSASVELPRQRAAADFRPRPLPLAPAGGGELVIRAARVYDGESARYRRNVDILIDAGRITAIDTQRDRGDTTVIDIGNTTVLPGLIDTYAGLPVADARSHALLLAFGVTTLVTPDLPAGDERAAAADMRTPAPRVLLAAAAGDAPGDGERPQVRLVTATADAANGSDEWSALSAWRQRGVPVLADSWAGGLKNGADMLLGTVSLPTSPAGRHYADVAGLTQGGPLLLVSGLADAATPGLSNLLDGAPAGLLPARHTARRRFVVRPRLDGGDSAVVVGSRSSGLPPGIATQAELLALGAAGLAPHEALHAATGAAAAALGLQDELGRIRPGARADLLLVAGDPLARLADASQVVALVLEGRFFSVSGLLEQLAASVE